MKLPALSDPRKYTGLYVFDFGDHVSVGYTGAEISILLASERFRSGQAYRIHRVLPDGTIHLQGVSRDTFSQQDGLFFLRSSEVAARADFNALRRAAEASPPPCHMKLHLVASTEAPDLFVTAVLFPAESTHDASAWLQRIAFEGGDQVTGGVHETSEYHSAGYRTIDQTQLWAAGPTGRSQGEVLATTHLAVQR